MTSSLCAVGSSSLQWLELLEGEFDRLFRELRLDVSALLSMEGGPGAVAQGMKSSVGALASVFAQLVHKSRTVFQSSCKLEAMVINVQSEVLQAKTECNQLQRELKARTLAARSLEVQLRQIERQEQDDHASRELDSLRAQLELEVERYHQSQSIEEELAASVTQLQQENSTLHEYVQSLTSQLAATALTSKYQQKELAGRIQQLQLVASGVRGNDLKALWQQITTEISLQKNKALLMAYHMRDKVVDRLLQPPAKDNSKSSASSQELRERVLEYATQRETDREVPKSRQVREVIIVRNEGEPLGMSVTGGSEHGVPVMISNLDKGKPACNSGLLQIGDAILSVNGHSLSGKTHEDAVHLLKSAGNTFQFKVAFIIGVPSPEEEKSEKEESEKSQAEEIEGLLPSSSHLISNRSSDDTVRMEQPQTDSPQNATATLPPVPHTDANSSETDTSVQTGRLETSASEEDTEQTTAQRLVSAFYLTPTSPEQLPLSYSEDADVVMFRYDQPENPALSSGSSMPRLNVSSVTHLLRVAGPSSPDNHHIVSHSTPSKNEAVARRPVEDSAVSDSFQTESASTYPPMFFAATNSTQLNQTAVAPPPPGQATAVTLTATPTSAVTPIVTSVTPPTESTECDPSKPTAPKEGNSLYHMTLTAVPIQSMHIPTLYDSDDVPLFSI